MKKVINIKNYLFTAEDNLFFDTNIWFYLMGSKNNPDRYAQIYADALDRIQLNKSKIFIDVIILSEFINRYAKHIAQQSYNIDANKYEKFCDSKEFKVVAEEVSHAVNRILSITARISSNFESLEMSSVLERFSEKRCGFNDQVLENICIHNNLKLVTNDIDFKAAKCTVLTANNSLLS